MFIIAFRGFGNSTRGKTLLNCLSLLDLVCLAREIQNFLRTKRDLKGRCGIYFTFSHLCGPLVPKLLEGFLFQFYF